MSARPLLERLVLALVEALADGDPVVTIGLADNELRVSWKEGR